jgi:23S rRNA pseudouridine1911/1915/1917 synthase
MAVVDLNHHPGKTASTSVRLLGNGNACCLVECTLQTGRTHQIRVHMASLGHPLLGDLLYGGAPLAGLQRQALHAYRLAFEHPTSRRMLSFSAQLPLDMVNAMDALGLRYNRITE